MFKNVSPNTDSISAHMPEDPTQQRSSSKEKIADSWARPDIQLFARKQTVSRGPMGSPYLRDALRMPTHPTCAFVRFLMHVERNDVDIGSGRSFRAMLAAQEHKGRPLLVAKCLCTDHILEATPNGTISHPEFMDGAMLFEALDDPEAELASLVELVDKLAHIRARGPRHGGTRRQNFEFWAINPMRMTKDIVCTRASLPLARAQLGEALDIFMSTDVKGYDAENSFDAGYAYVVAGMYSRGYIVNKDEDLAKRSVAFLQKTTLAFSQAEALRTALDLDLRIVDSLLALGVDATATDRQGWSLVSCAKDTLSGTNKACVLAILHRRGFH